MFSCSDCCTILVQFYDKFNIRHNIAELLEYLWQIAKKEKGVYLNFLNFLVSESIFLLAESLNRILELKEIEKEMANTVEWERRSAQERQKTTRQFHSQENIILIGDGRCRHASTYFRTDYNAFSSSRDSPQRKSPTLKGPKKYEFHPKILLKRDLKIDPSDAVVLPHRSLCYVY
ncbi:probable ubiquitin conjugation factor E4 [Papaver somniferum]|uniref:probable ubiquitin conjugation factor E4 n=1 Tax=Papaver somniferum TaxID=3469 RepID=UPI000E6F4BF8|nr:probable ubiquitin conjugation factor E4 [Papaver somniferum]